MLHLNVDTLNEEFCMASREILIDSRKFLRHIEICRSQISKLGHRIAISEKDSYLFSVAFFATLSLEKIVVLLPNQLKGTTETFCGEYDDLLSDINSFNEWLPDEVDSYTISPEASVVFFTSGSLGLSKKVVKRFRNLTNEISGLEKVFGSSLKDTLILSTASHQHIYGFLFKILWPVMSKRTWHAKAFDYVEQIVDAVTGVQKWALITTPAFLKRIYMDKAGSYKCAALFSSGGELPSKYWEACRSFFGVWPTEIFGSTESGGVAFRNCEGSLSKWVPLPNVDISADKDNRMIVSSPHFEEDLLQMSDKISIGEVGFEFLGRTDDVVKIEEKRVSLDEMNKRILELDIVKDSRVLFLETNSRQQTVCVAVIESQVNYSEAIAIIRKHLLHFFEPITVPRKFRFLDSLPYNSQSKLNRNELLELFK